jgi:hypothetical protein
MIQTKLPLSHRPPKSALLITGLGPTSLGSADLQSLKNRLYIMGSLMDQT